MRKAVEIAEALVIFCKYDLEVVLDYSVATNEYYVYSYNADSLKQIHEQDIDCLYKLGWKQNALGNWTISK